MKKRMAKNLSEEQIAYLKENYHNTSNEELAEAIGCSIHTIKSRRTKLGLRKDDDFLSRLYSEVATRCESYKRINTPEAYAKRAKTRKALYDCERVRIKWGLEQKTRRHFRTEPKSKLCQRNRLQRQGYIIDEANLTAFYTEKTKRCRRLEAIPRGVKKGTIKPYYSFAPYEERRMDTEGL